MKDNGYMKKKVIVNLLLLLVTILTIGGCATKIEKLDIKLPSSDKIPLRVGLYMSPEFRKYTYSTGGLVTPIGKFYIGEGLSIGAEKALKQVFNEVVIINNKSDISNQNIKAVISPEILDVAAEQNVVFFKMLCRWTISGADGKIYYNDTITGVGKDTSLAFATRERKAMTKAIENHYYKFIEQMLSSKWWENIK
jgi:hypothetical protein